MRISAIKSYQTNPNFHGDNSSGKTNRLKNAAAAAAVAIAAAIPADDADAQILYPPVYPPVYPTITAPPSLNPVPNCFIVGDNSNVDYNKSMRQVFNEIDANGNENGVISASEVLKTERQNWNRYSIYCPFTQTQALQTQAKFNALAETYNEEDSNPKTINYNEYKAIMKDYMEAKKVADFINLFTLPGIMYPPPPPPHHHHYYSPRHRHDAPPPPRHHRH